MSLSQPESSQVFLSQAAYDHLKEELDRLIAERPEISKEVNDRREEGDLKENAGYHAARDEQARREGRIKELQRTLADATVGEAPKSTDGTALPGTVVTVRFEHDEDVETFLLASREERRVSEIDVYSPQSPLGKAIHGAKVGDVREFPLPNGKTMRVTLEKVEPHEG